MRDTINSVAISSNNSFIVTVSHDKTAKIWDIASSKCITTLKGHKSSIRSVAISSDDSFIITGSPDTTTKIWGG